MFRLWGSLRDVTASLQQLGRVDWKSLELVGWLRGMERFAGLGELKAAMAADVERARFLLT